MSEADTNSEQDNDEPIPERNEAKRVFATEFNDTTYQYKESNAERAPKWSMLPTGERANRVFVCGTVTEVNETENDGTFQAVINDGTEGGSFFAYAGEYNPDAARKIRELNPPEHVAVVGKIRVYDPEDEDRTLVSLRPETLKVVDKDTKFNWILDTAEATVERARRFKEAPAEAGGEIGLAREQYGEDVSAYVATAEEALESLR